MTVQFRPGSLTTERDRRHEGPSVPGPSRRSTQVAVATVAVVVVALGSWWVSSLNDRAGTLATGSPSSTAPPQVAPAAPSTTTPSTTTPTTLVSPAVTGGATPAVSTRTRTTVPSSRSISVSGTGVASAQAPGPGDSTEQASINYASTAPEPPVADLTATPDLTVACRSPSSATCLDAALLAFDNARASEGIGPLTLPSDFEGLTPGEQLLVLVDCERVDRGLTPVAGELDALDGLAAVGAVDDADPSFPSGGLNDVTAWAWAANWASAPSVLSAVYEWMYDDGPGSGNIDCTIADPSGCWDHRDNILGFQNDVGAYGGSLSFGGATVQLGSTHGASSLSVTTLTTWSPGPTSGYTYTWAEAVAAGAA